MISGYKTLLTVMTVLVIASQVKANQEENKPVIKDYLTYTLQSGESFDSITYRYKPEYVSLKEFISKVKVLNNRQEMIRPGTKILIPIYAKEEQ